MEFLTYQRFSNKEEATEFANLLQRNHINFLLEDYSLAFDATFANNDHDKEYRIKLKKTDFEVADKLQFDLSNTFIETIDKDYYLFDFTDQELLEVITRSDEWSKLDYTLAQKILKDRGKEVNADLLKALRKQRIEELAKPDEGQNVWVFAGYLFAILGGFIGLFIGWHLLTHKKTLPNGDRIEGYSKTNRKHGKYILIIGAVSLLLWTTAEAISPLRN